MNCLVIGCVWPEPKSSAAGENMMTLLQGALQHGWKVTFASAAQPSVHAENLLALGIEQKTILLNDSSFEHFIQALSPDIVIFDRFMTEEQFAWRVNKILPNTLRVLNTEDLHGLRKQTQLNFQGKTISPSALNDVILREVSTILRCDLTMVISRDEIDWLTQNASVKPSQLIYFPLLPILEECSKKSLHFDDRQHISFIGNFKHAPNWHAVLYLRKVWPQIRKQLPDAECHIYGAYPPKKATDLQNVKLGFLIKGWVDDANDAFSSYRLSVAPLQFGAGVKGKLIRAIANGVPCVVSPLAIQGIGDEQSWSGLVAKDENEFINAVTSLYTDKPRWIQCNEKAKRLCEKLNADTAYHQAFFQKCESLLLENKLDTFRNQHLLTQVLNHHTLKSHQYMAQWIEAKNRLKN